MDEAELIKRFVYHRPEGRRITAHEDLRPLFLEIAATLNRMLPESREKALAMTTLEESSMWAHAAVARNMEP